MNYEKMYKEALERVKEQVTSGNCGQEMAEYLFPELKESEDERIWKALIEYFQVDGYLCGNISSKDVRAWLEKQDVQAIKEALRTEYEKGRADAIAEIQNPVWSEEDEKMLGKCIDAASGYYSPEDKQSMKDWLRQLKSRIVLQQLQPKQEL